jgi:hypothetical protein
METEQPLSFSGAFTALEDIFSLKRGHLRRIGDATAISQCILVPGSDLCLQIQSSTASNRPYRYDQPHATIVSEPDSKFGAIFEILKKVVFPSDPNLRR